MDYFYGLWDDIESKENKKSIYNWFDFMSTEHFNHVKFTIGLDNGLKNFIFKIVTYLKPRPKYPVI